MPYIPNTPEDQREMLAAMGLESLQDLFREIPAEVWLNRPLQLPEALSEWEVEQLLGELANLNGNLREYVSFLGAGAYDHYIPAAVDAILSRGEFYTAYTPYQAEISQGTLQAIYEFQTMICELTGLDVANASMYDGASALAEGVLLAQGATRRPRVLLSHGVHPEYRQTVETYLHVYGGEEEVPTQDGVTDLAALEGALDDQVAAVVIQQPNFFGSVEEGRRIAELAHRHGALLIVVTDPMALGVLEAPGHYGADVVLGEGQPLGNSVSFGGPYLGFFAVHKDHMRRIPGRVVGATVDKDGRQGFVLTLQTREQHIRRERATSNICTNQALNALAATVYLSLVGPAGLREVGRLSLEKAHYAARRIAALPGYELAFGAPFFKEFVVKTPTPVSKIEKQLIAQKILPGVDLGRFDPALERHLLVCVTEKRSREEIDRLVEGLGAIR